MKSLFKKIILRSFSVLAFCLFLLVLFLLNPNLLYAHKTVYKNCTIYHNQSLRPDLKNNIDLSLEVVKESVLYKTDFKSDLCLNDGSFYPKLVKTILGEDVFTAFSNKVVVLGTDINEDNSFRQWDRSMKYSQFLSHGLMHNLQFLKHGLWDSNPIGRHPMWKWEGYVEYVVLGPNYDLKDLIEEKLLNAIEEKDYEWVTLEQQEGTIQLHLKYLAMSKFCLDIEGLDYHTFLNDNREQKQVWQEMMDWYARQTD